MAASLKFLAKLGYFFHTLALLSLVRCSLRYLCFTKSSRGSKFGNFEMETKKTWVFSWRKTPPGRDDMFGLWGYHPPSDAGRKGIGQEIGFGRIGNREFQICQSWHDISFKKDRFRWEISKHLLFSFLNLEKIWTCAFSKGLQPSPRFKKNFAKFGLVKYDGNSYRDSMNAYCIPMWVAQSLKVWVGIPEPKNGMSWWQCGGFS